MRRVEAAPIDPRRLEPLIGRDRLAAFLTAADGLTGCLDGRRLVNVNGGALGAGERAAYEETIERNAKAMSSAVRPGDGAIVHDPQPAPLVASLAEAGASVVWRCHVGFDGQTSDGPGSSFARTLRRRTRVEALVAGPRPSRSDGTPNRARRRTPCVHHVTGGMSKP